MTKKKGFFSKIKSKLSKDQDDQQDLYDHDDSEEYEEIEEDQDHDGLDEEEQDLDASQPPIPPIEDPTLDVYVDDLTGDEDDNPGFLKKLKNKLTKNSDIDDQDEEDEEFEEYEDQHDEQEDDASKYNVMQRMLNKVRDKARELDTSAPGSKRSKSGQEGAQYFLPNLLSNESRPKIHQVFLILLTCALLYQAGKMLALFLNKECHFFCLIAMSVAITSFFEQSLFKK